MSSAHFTPADAPYTLIAVVTPMTGDPATSGKIRHLSCSPTIKHACLRSYEVQVERNGEIVVELAYSVEPAFAKAGYVLLEALFQAERMEDEWKLYQQLLRDIARGRPVKPFPVEKLPREVRRRRACGAEVEETAAPAAADVTKAVDAVTKGRARV